MNRAVSGAYPDEHDDSDDGERSFSEQLDLQHYLRILRKHKWPIVLFTAAVTALAGYYAFTATPIYSATSTLLIEQQKANVVSIEELYGVESENTDYYQTQFELLKSPSLSQRVVERLDLWNHPELSAVVRGAAPVSEAGSVTLSEASDDVAADPGASGGILDSVLERVGLGGQRTGSDAADGEAVVTADGVTLNLDPASPGLVDGAPGADGSGVEGFGADGSVIPGIDGMPSTVGASSSFPSSAGYGERVPSFDGFGSEPALDSNQQQVLAEFQDRLSISPVRKTKLVNISFESADPVLAARVANTVGEQYITSYLDAKLEMTNKASEWLNERLAALKERLDESEARLIAFKQENGLVDVDGGVARLNEQQLLLLTAELAQARSELSSTEDIFRDVQSLRDRPDLLESIPDIQSDPLVQQIKIQQGTAQRELDELLNRYGERHPRVVDAKSQLASLDNTLQGHIRRVVGTIEKDYQLARQRVASINASLSSGKSDIQAIGNKKFELDALEREAATNRDIYDQFFSRMTEAKSADGLETANARISDYARPPILPVKPKKQLIIALAALASLVLSMLMAFLYETMDDTVKSTNDIEHKLGLRLLGILPLIKGGLFGKAQELPLNPTEISDKKGTFSEAVNTARTALCMGETDGSRQVVMVTSSIPGEGKSTAAINLAYSLGQLERVLLIDCDMRRPTIAKAAGLDKNVVGLGNLITNTATAHDCIKRGQFGGAVDILPSGPVPDQPLELLSSRRFEKILEQLRRHYDRIVIDSAPTQAVSDALVLSKLSDAVIYVVKSHDTSIELVKRGVQRLEQVNAPIAGVLITQVDIDKITAYGGDYYYQGYYDYYGYTDEGDRSRRPGKIKLSQEELIRIKSDDRDVDLGLDYGAGAAGNRDRSRTASVRESLRERPAAAREGGSRAFSDDAREARAEREEADTVAIRRRMDGDLDIL